MYLSMRLPPSRKVVWGACALISLAVGTPAAATILTFDQVRDATAGDPVMPTVSGRDVPLDCADRVTAGLMDVPGGQFTYGEGGEGFAPNVTTELFSNAATAIGPGVSLWQDRDGGLVNMLLCAARVHHGTATLTTAPSMPGDTGTKGRRRAQQ
jgi:hypothetical protein